MPNYHNAECTIGDNIVVNILGVEGGAVKIGIDAPREVTILRMEVWEQPEGLPGVPGFERFVLFEDPPVSPFLLVPVRRRAQPCPCHDEFACV